MRLKTGDWVQIQNTVLESKDRAPTIPEDTRKTPLNLWVKGYLLHDADIGDLAEIKTTTGRLIKGIVEISNPCYSHDFGSFVPELQVVERQIKELLYGGDLNEC